MGAFIITLIFERGLLLLYNRVLTKKILIVRECHGPGLYIKKTSGLDIRRNN
jgi:hypothetical protein